MTSVAIIGGGLSGISAAKACLSQELQVTLFEQRPVLGGIWSLHDTPVFQHLTTNTSIYETVLSDVPPLRLKPERESSDSLCYTRDEMFRYVQRILESSPGIRRHARLSTRVLSLRRVGGRFQLCYTSITASGPIHTVLYDRVIVACGMFQRPLFPSPSQLPGIDVYTNKVMHVRDYQHPAQVARQRVLIVGGSISGCEAAADIAQAVGADGPTSVALSTRTMRYLISKQKHDRLIVSVRSTRFHYLRKLAGRYGHAECVRDLMREVEPSNAEYGAPDPSGPIKRPFQNGYIPVHQNFLDACKAGTIEWKVGGLRRLTPTGAEFLDGSVGMYDRIIFATGYEPDLSFLEKDICDKVFTPGSHCLNLYDFTFHPDLEHIAFVGTFSPGSATTPMLDAQARWVARVFAGELKRVKKAAMWAGLKAEQAWRACPESHNMVYGYESMDRFARHAGFEVDLAAYPDLAKGLIFSPMVPAQFRMFGHGKLDRARGDCERQLRASGFEIGDRVVTREHMDELKRVLGVLQHREDCPKGLREAVACLRCE